MKIRLGTHILVLVCCAFPILSFAASSEDNWQPLFNGTNLDRWTEVGGAKWTVQDGMLIGEQGPGGKAGELLTEAEYDDFVLRLAFKVNWPANSGVWFRYQSPQVAYQADILEYTNPVAWSGTFYCTGKMFLAVNEDESLVNRDGWNTLEIWAKGDHVKIRLNEQLVADVHDNTTDHGKIGFQIHQGDQFNDMKIWVRNIRIRPLGPEAEEDNWRSLFNGKNLDGWTGVGKAAWTVEDGMLVGRQGENRAPGDLLTTEDYSDFLLRLAYKVNWPANTGVWFRYQSPDVAYQADILEYTNPVAWSGTLYCPGKLFLAVNEDESLVNREGWNTMEIRAEGDHVRIRLNEHLVADVHDKTTDHGKIGFQVHQGDQFASMAIIARDMRLLPLGDK